MSLEARLHLSQTDFHGILNGHITSLLLGSHRILAPIFCIECIEL